MIAMKKFHVGVVCEAMYYSVIEVPDKYTYEQAVQYVQEHIDEIPVTTLNWISDSDQVDAESCWFEDDGKEVEP